MEYKVNFVKMINKLGIFLGRFIKGIKKKLKYITHIIYIYTHTHTHIYIHTHIHIHTHPQAKKLSYRTI